MVIQRPGAGSSSGGGDSGSDSSNDWGSDDDDDDDGGGSSSDSGSNLPGAQPAEPPDAPDPDDGDGDGNGGSSGGGSSDDPGSNLPGAQPAEPPDAPDDGGMGGDDDPSPSDPGSNLPGARPVGGPRDMPGGDDPEPSDPGSNLPGQQPFGAGTDTRGGQDDPVGPSTPGSNLPGQRPAGMGSEPAERGDPLNVVDPGEEVTQAEAERIRGDDATITQSQFQQYQDATERDISPTDLRVVGGQVVFSQAYQGEQQERALESATDQAEANLEEEFGRDLEPGEDFFVVETEDGYDVQLSEDLVAEQAGGQVETQTGQETIGFGAEAAAGAFGVPIEGEAVGGAVDPDVAAEFGLEQGEDFTIDVEGGEANVEATESFREEQVAQQLGVPASIIDEGEDYTRGDDGDIELTAEGRQTGIEAQAIKEGEVSVDRPEADLPGFGTIGGGEETTDIYSPEQLEFDDEGNLVNVREFDETEAGEQAGRQRLEDAIPLVGGPVSDVAFGSRDFLQGAGDFSTDVGAAVFEGRSVQDFVDTDLPGTDVQVGLEPAAEVTGDVAGLAQESGEFYLQGGGENAADVREATFDIARGEEDEQGGANLAEGATQNLALGAGDIARAGIELPETVSTGTDVVGQGAAFTVQNPADAPGAGVDAAVGLGETVAVQTVNNPLRTTGALVGSAGIMGGAARVSSRAGTASRFAIQPGEELIGYGGGSAFRRLGGERTTRAGERLFPNNEPVIFSEEAAIRAGQRVTGGLRTVGSRARGSFREFAADESAQLRTPGAGRVQRTEADVDDDVVTLGGDDIPGDVDPYAPEAGGEMESVYERDPDRSFQSVDPTTEGSVSQQDIGSGIAGEGDPAPARESAGTVSENFGQYLREQEVEQRQREAAFQQAQTTGSAGTPGGVSVRYGTEAEQRLEEAQQPDVLQEDAGPLGVEEDLTADMQAELETAQEAEVRQDSRLDLDRRFETAFDQEQQPFTDEDVGMEGDRAFDQPLELEGESDLQQELEAEQTADVEQESIFQQEFETETDAEMETETETESEFGFRPELETETETETELEMEMRPETRREVEGELFPDEEDDEGGFGGGFFAEDETFASGIASAEDVLGDSGWSN